MQISDSRIVYLSSAGYGLLFSIALVGAARIASGLTGTPLSDATANTILGFSTLILVPALTYFRFAGLFVLPAANRG